MSKEHRCEDDNHLESGDLGLGLGLKPGSLPLLNVTEFATDDRSVHQKRKEGRHLYPNVDDKPLIPPPQSKFNSLTKLCRSFKSGQIALSENIHFDEKKSCLQSSKPKNSKLEYQKDHYKSEVSHSISGKVEKRMTGGISV